MSGLTSPAASPVAPSVAVAPPSATAPGVPSLAAFVDLMIGKIVPPGGKAVTGDGKWQDDAADGKSLPGRDQDVDPALAWLFGMTQPLPTPQPVPPSPSGKLPIPSISVGPDILVEAGTQTTAPAAAALLSDPYAAAPKPATFPLPAIKLPNQPPVAPVAPQPAASAALPALFALAMTADRTSRDDDAVSLPPITAATIAQADAAPIAPTGDAQRQTLDLGRQDWPQKMIDHIEALRDNANANDTSIRLKPEALGRVDVSLRAHDDGAISVRFAAEQPTTRTLLIDAAPQLAAAAEARGIRLSGTSVDLGGQGEQRPRAQNDQPQNITNHLAASRGEDVQAADDGRIA